MNSCYRESSSDTQGADLACSSASLSPTSRSGSTNHQMTPLPEDFVPGIDDVVCGRGKKCYNHIGNERFRRRVIGMLDEYAKAKSKPDKSAVLFQVMAEVRRSSPVGGFVKQDDGGRWYEVGDFLAREKTSQAFRDALHERYKSSNVSKKKRRREGPIKLSADTAQMIAFSEREVTSKIERMETEAKLYSHQQLPSHAHSDATSFYAASLHEQSLPSPGSGSQQFGMLHQSDFHTLSALENLRNRAHGHPFGPGNQNLNLMQFSEALQTGNSGFGTSNSFRNRDIDTLLFAQRLERNEEYTADNSSMTSGRPHHPAVFDFLTDVQANFNDSLRDFHFNSLGAGANNSGVGPLHNSLPNIHLSEPGHHYNGRFESSDPHVSAMHTSLPNLSNLRNFMQYEVEPNISVERHPNVELEPCPVMSSRLVSPQKQTSNFIPMDNKDRSSMHKRTASWPKLVDPLPPTSDKDIISCLEKLTEHNISDDNPFEPVPLPAECSPTKNRCQPDPTCSSVVGSPFRFSPINEDSNNDELGDTLAND